MLALVVDDSRAMRAVLSRLLHRLGLDVAQAGDGAEALALLRSGVRPGVVLVDWNMPVMDGLTFVRECRASDDYRDIALMMVTTEGDQAQITRALAAGAHEYVIKPFTDEAIAQKLALLGLVAA
jgi:two-component system chemotaxis response regulator CheY